MKVIFEWPIKAMSGKSSDGKSVFCILGDICYKRRYTKPLITAHNNEYGAKFKRIGQLYKDVPETFKESLRIYANEYNKQLKPDNKGPLHLYHIFTKALCKGKVSLSDLESIDKIIAKFGGTIEEWIQHGLLDKVKGKSINASFHVPVKQFSGLGMRTSGETEHLAGRYSPTIGRKGGRDRPRASI